MTIQRLFRRVVFPTANLALFSIGCFAGTVEPSSATPAERMSLWYGQPAGTNWLQALPVGNGRLGVMVFGGVERERLQMNEDTLWAGGPYDPVNPDARAAQPEARSLIFDWKIKEATDLVSKKIIAKPDRQMPYETVGDLFLDFPAVESAKDYRRDLNLNTAIATTVFEANGVRYTREVFSSEPDQVMVVSLTADKPGGISFTSSMRSPQISSVSADARARKLMLTGTNGEAFGIKGALKFQAQALFIPKVGKLECGPATLSVSNADSVLILIAANTSYRSYDDVTGDPVEKCNEQLRAAASKSYVKLKQRHIESYQKLFGKVKLDLGHSDAANLPTVERIRNFATTNDPELAAIYFQFGRYLLISCSRKGGQPANLQGLWNESMSPPWGGKYTININTEMNYWPAEPANLGECVEPLVDMVAGLSKTGATTAREMYGARGWVAHHNTDLWRASAPIDGPNSGMWPTGGAWLCYNLWDHYLFSGDREFLGRIYPMLKGASEFFIDTLVEDPTNHFLVTCPSISPEHAHHKGQALCAGPAMDQQIIRDLFDNTMHAAELLGKDAEFRGQLAQTRSRLAPDKIGASGQLQEWQEDWDMTATDINHRHVSHLYGLYPSTQINLEDTPELAAAVKRSLEIRGDKATGWATAWRINLWAHLHEGNHAYEIFKFLLSPQRTYPNMFDAHPPFQIDGNFGGTAGLAEMLLQSREIYGKGGGVQYEIELLPALPDALANGSVAGLRARGGFEIGMRWANGGLAEASILSLNGNKATVHCGKEIRELKLGKGETTRWTWN